MPTFARRLRPPSEDVAATMTDAEDALMAGAICVAGLCEGDDGAVCASDAPDIAAAEGVARGDPAVVERSMRAGLRPFRVVPGTS